MKNTIIKKRPRLTDLCSECFMLIMQLRTTDSYGDEKQLRKQILALFDRMERRAKRRHYDIKDIQKAKFALIAFLDETISSSNWQSKESWVANPLQLEIFNRYDAGEKFFQLLDRFRARPYDYIELLEVYFLCISLGFKGKYSLNDQQSLRQLIEETYSDYKTVGREDGLELAPNCRPKDDMANVIKKDIPAWVIGSGALLIALVFYIVLTIINYNIADNTAEAIMRIM